MWNTTQTNNSDPLAAFMAGAFTPDRQPVPLVSTRFDVEILGGLAVVETVRTFRNEEPVTIEATITFPVPVHAALYRLQASVDGRRLTATAKARKAAREDYETAVDAGRSAVLHEEVLKGVHTLSVAHIAPGTEIEIATTWVASLSLVGTEARFRVPLTVGDIYGRSRLNEADDLVTGGAPSMARLNIRSDAGVVHVAGVTPVDGFAEVPLNAPIDLTIAEWSPRDVTGLTANGHAVRLSFHPALPGDGCLSLAILVDHSGSMASSANAADAAMQSKHQAAVEALSTYPCRPGDRFDLWQFDSKSSRVGQTIFGEASPSALRDLAFKLEEPRGGTEIGSALENVLVNSRARDILLITDGQSYALDVHQLAARGRRISVILVGEDSLDANVGHLASLTGGDIWVAAGADIGSVMQSAIDSARARVTPAERVQGRDAERAVVVDRSGLRIEATWAGPATGADAGSHPAAAPFATSLLLTMLPENEAGTLAAAEGLVTHLTSLVLVDEASAIQEDIPLLRKVALPAPRINASVCYSIPSPPASPASKHSGNMAAISESYLRAMPPGSASMDLSASDESWAALEQAAPASSPEETQIDELRALADFIEWGAIGNNLIKGDLSGLEDWVRRMIERRCKMTGLQRLADGLGVDSTRLLIAAIAHYATGDRHAQRVAKRLATAAQIEALIRFLIGEEPEPAGASPEYSSETPQKLEAETVARRLMRGFLRMKTKPIDLS